MRVAVVLVSVAVVVSGGCGTVRRGSRGECVKSVQRAVGVTADGIFGPNTERAVRTFQRRSGLSVDGIVGRKTWAAINGGGGGGGGSGNSCGCGYDYATKCSGGPTPGARNLASYIKGRYGGRTEIYNCRNVRGGSTKSLHAEGRAVDVYVSLSTGRRMMNHIKSIACANGIQEVIHNRRIWTKRRGETSYSGSNPHTDHVHIGLNHCGARKFNL